MANTAPDFSRDRRSQDLAKRLKPRWFQRRLTRPAPPVGRAAAGLVGAALTVAGCAYIGAATAPFEPTVIDAARLVQPPQPPTLVARSERDIADIVQVARPERLASWKGVNGSEQFEGPQIPFFFESEIGRAYLRSGPGRAVARGEPAESCPLFGVSLDASAPTVAAEQALTSCLARRDVAEASCGCRLLAAENVLFAPAEAFSYARAVNAAAIPLDRDLRPRGPEAALIAEERFQPRAEQASIDATASLGVAVSGLEPSRREDLAAGARRLWLIGLAGPVAGLDLSADGEARLTLLEGPRDGMRPVRRFEGKWRAEGFRRGRLAEHIALSGPDGDRLVLLIGYEPAELASERSRLLQEARTLF
ncbi:MAG: hypothetical protein AAF909_12135 [Pseudomonadota bacterium]